MTARTGQQYLLGLKDQRRVWLGNQAVSVTEEMRFQGSLVGLAGYYDWQHEYAEDCLVPDPETGQPMSASLLVPRRPDDLRARQRCFESIARYSRGMMGRTPDYVNCTLAGFVARADALSSSGDTTPGERLRKFHRDVIAGDLSLTHALVQPAIDRGVDEVSGLNATLAAHVTRRTKTGIVIRGARVLATLGPFADEMFVYPAAPLPANADPKYAVMFSIPVNTPGLIQVCRDHYGVPGAGSDHPFSSRFDEQDSFVIFDDVEVPYERVFIDGDVKAYNGLVRTGWYANISQQTNTRAAVKLEFAYDLGCRMAEITNTVRRPEVAGMLGEILEYARLARAAVNAGIAGARDWGNGALFPDDLAARATRAMLPQWMVRTNEILVTLGSHNLLATPSLEAFDHSELGPLLERYLPGADGHSAKERAMIFRTAWDFVGSALGSRIALYERFYLASQFRALSGDHMAWYGANASNAERPVAQFLGD
ncbi:4-hydroxyphenylacetate 3-hydroxylase N-terminal domain-containing protein [Noviherbaspirillum saxi]|uniref:Aromatic ring hydroxylase n=1 Tax=Noviherbaspirillum saxi TaxID=2320863 RepID=A0A3A3FIN4_9BURK|nr:4-hydroxyphenylacetate 3-hydroxylase N-terminal domain-containing protein [Noviherbaspirillum saxi]RJF92248.1 aromatic ring hydroxylase [Noviherbaspirillum saxi]